jgi:hypothetical protein
MWRNGPNSAVQLEAQRRRENELKIQRRQQEKQKQEDQRRQQDQRQVADRRPAVPELMPSIFGVADRRPAMPELMPEIRVRPKTPDGFADYSDPQWMQSISNSTICNWFYTFYLANLIVFFLVIGAGAYMFFRNKRQFTATNLFLALLQLIVAGTNMLFFYLICDRTLNP